MHLIALTDLGLAALIAMTFLQRRGLMSSLKGPEAGRLRLLCSSPLLLGVVGWRLGLYQMNKALPLVHADQVAEFIERGQNIAQIPLKFGLGSSLALLVAALILFRSPSGDPGHRGT